MTITTRAGYEAARKVRRGMETAAMNANAPGRYWWGSVFNCGPDFGGASVTTPAAFGAGGSLISANGNGFLRIASYSSQVGEMTRIVGTTGSPPKMVLGFYDIVWLASGFALNSTAEQTVVGFPALTRPNANGDGLQAFMVVRTVASSSTATNVTLKYTNQSGVADKTATLLFGSTPSTWAASAGTGVVRPFAHAAGDTGIQAVQSIQLGAAQGSAGDLWIGLARHLFSVSFAGYSDPLVAGLHEFNGDEAVAVMGLEGLSTVTVAGRVDIDILEG